MLSLFPTECCTRWFSLRDRLPIATRSPCARSARSVAVRRQPTACARAICVRDCSGLLLRHSRPSSPGEFQGSHLGAPPVGLVTTMVAMAAAIVGVLQPQSAPAQSGSAAAVAINVDVASSHPGPAAAPPAAAGAPADQQAGPAPQGGHRRRPRSRSRRADSPPIPPPTAEQQRVDALSRQLAAVQQQLVEAQAEIARLRSAGGWLQRPARAPPSRPNPQPDQSAARPAAPERRPDE